MNFWYLPVLMTWFTTGPIRFNSQIMNTEKISKEKKNKDQLPNRIDLKVLSRLLKYSDRYEISIQFWPEQIAVFISKDGIDLQDYGGDFDSSIIRSIEYLDRITRNCR